MEPHRRGEHDVASPVTRVLAGIAVLGLYVVGYVLVLGLLYGLLAATNPWAAHPGLGLP